ncbi:two-component system, NarL family, sensor histidine kinase UhpB [Luteibacter sp. 22Crub2.1]|nr:two-component system, NarL family, sensor histidine kinase UhpB [Luteibacter sp. 22Crub2.1]
MPQSMKRATGSTALWCSGVLVGTAGAQLLSAALWSEQGGTHIVWFPGAVLLGALLASPLCRWPWLTASALAGLIGACVGLFHLPVLDTAMVLIAATALVPPTAWLLLQVRGGSPLLQDFGKLMAFGTIVIVALPAGAATLIGLVAPYTAFPGYILSDWPNVALAHSLGYVLYIPAWISVRSSDAAVRHSGPVSVLFLIGMAASIALLGTVWYTFGDRPGLLPLLCLAPAPILTAACLRAQMAGSAAAMFVIVVMAAHMSVDRHGPFVSDSLQSTTLGVQLWTLGATVCALVVSAIVEQRHASQRALDLARIDMRELAGHLIATQEQERARLARDIHDDINQRLAATSIGLSALRRRLPQPASTDVGTLQTQVIELSEDLRLMSHQLHPGWLSHAGLREALQALCASPRHAGEPDVSLSVPPEVGALSGEVALCFYRVAQEALRNALRHAEASRVDIAVAVSDSQAVLRIADDGQGFDPDDLRFHPSGIGLISMSERAKLLGGSFDLRSAPGKGVELCIRIPLKDH